MAKLFGSKQATKGQHVFKNGFSSEAIKDGQFNSPPPDKKPSIFKLGGILGLGQTVELNKQSNTLNSWGQEFISGVSHLEKEEKLLLDNRQKELFKEIAALQDELKQLAKATDQLDKQVDNAVDANVVEVSAYQVGFFRRLKTFIANFRKNISQASIWLESYSAKKKKRNCFWNQVKNKKGGGEQYLFSNEHSAARSAT
ncbi:MAG: DUF5660 family protein [Candidatus Shapirobacteria bacterium]|jgi:hypothetical protein